MRRRKIRIFYGSSSLGSPQLYFNIVFAEAEYLQFVKAIFRLAFLTEKCFPENQEVLAAENPLHPKVIDFRKDRITYKIAREHKCVT